MENPSSWRLPDISTRGLRMRHSNIVTSARAERMGWDWQRISDLLFLEEIKRK